MHSSSLALIGGSSIVSSDYVGNHNATTGDGKQVVIDVSGDDKTYYYCNQDMARYQPLAFPAIPSKQPDGGEWMTPEQDFARIFGLTSVAIIVAVILVVLNNLRKKLSGWFVSPYAVSFWLLQRSAKAWRYAYTSSSQTHIQF